MIISIIQGVNKNRYLVFVHLSVMEDLSNSRNGMDMDDTHENGISFYTLIQVERNERIRKLANRKRQGSKKHHSKKTLADLDRGESGKSGESNESSLLFGDLADSDYDTDLEDGK